MNLRFASDRRTLVWALALFPLGPALALWRPALLPWLAPLLLYCSYLSGVLTHNHGHVPVFRERWANVAYGGWLSVFYGFPIFSWVPTHNQNHHRYRNGGGDITATWLHAPRDGLLKAISYPIASSGRQLPVVLRFARDAFRTKSSYRARVVVESVALVVGHAAFLALSLLRHGAVLGALTYVAALGLPAFLGGYWMMLTNYLQHVGCDAESDDDHSRNFVSPFFNWFVFHNGYHTVHHDQPSAHWSRYPELHHARAHAIAPRLNRGGIVGTYLLTRYLRGAGE
jgi:beta-carotene hydroxylase